MMAIFKTICLIILLITGTAFAAPAPSEITIPATELVQLINYEEPVQLITQQALEENCGSPFEINGYQNMGFEYDSRYYGISFVYNPEKTTVKEKKMNREMTQTLASRDILIPLLREKFSETDLSDVLLNEYLSWQIINGTEFEVNETFRIKFLNQNHYTGYCYIVDSKQLTLLSTTEKTVFLQDILKNPRGYAERFEEEKGNAHVIRVFEYCVENQDENTLDFSIITKIKLYLSALYLTEYERGMAEEMLNQIPENLSEVFAKGNFRAEDYLLLGDLNLIFENEERAFSAWGYGVQLYPLNEVFEERFEKYSTE